MRGAVMSCAQMAGSWPERLDHKTVAELSRAAQRPRRGVKLCDTAPRPRSGLGLNELLGVRAMILLPALMVAQSAF